MPPLPSYLKASFLKTLAHQIPPNASQAQLSTTTPPLPDPLSFLSKCKGKHHLNQIHAHMITSGIIHSPPAASKLVASLAASSVHSAHLVADRTEVLDSYTWNTALTRFCQMQREGYRPDDILFSSILSACSHSGLVDEGCTCFRSMIEDYRIRPDLMHYGIMVDLLCRAGLVSEAFQFVMNMSITPDVIMWRMLLAACKNEGRVSIANQIRSHLLELEPEYGGNYVLLSNLSANAGEWDEVQDLRTNMRAKGVNKQDVGCSLIEIN